MKLGLDRTWRIPTVTVLRLVGVSSRPYRRSGPRVSCEAFGRVAMGRPDRRVPADLASIGGPSVVLDRRSLESVRSLRPMAWAVLEAVALEATADEDGLVAHTSARHLAGLLGLDPGTAAAALRLLRQRGHLDLRRTAGSAGRFGLSAYVVGNIVDLGLRPCVVGPDAVAPRAPDPHGHRPPGEPGAATTPSDQAGSGGHSSAKRPAAQGAFDLGLEADG